MGPRGLPGEIGRTEHIAIDETETLEPGEEAQVMDTFEDWVHHLTFQIPKGEQGIQGPRGIQGPAGPPGTNFVSAYGIRYAMMDTQITLEQAIDTTIPLAETGVSLFTEYTNNGIKINADVNGSSQIMKKVFPNAFADGIEGVVLYPVRVDVA